VENPSTKIMKKKCWKKSEGFKVHQILQRSIMPYRGFCVLHQHAKGIIIRRNCEVKGKVALRCSIHLLWMQSSLVHKSYNSPVRLPVLQA
jgi:hypothetical protein